MFSPFSLLSSLFLLSSTILATSASTSSVKITAFSKNQTSLSGSGNVAAAGHLPPFGDIGLGCGINWQAEAGTFGGGLQAGSPTYGLGSGFTATSEKITIGAGIGLHPDPQDSINSVNNTASIEFTGWRNGSVELVFESSGEVVCESGAKEGEEGRVVVRCWTL